jgi:hypothetical protein
MGIDAMKGALAIVLCVACSAGLSEARIQGYHGGARVNTQNRSANINRDANLNRNANINRNANVNVNRNADVNINRDVDVHGDGWYRGGYVVYDDDPGWNWGSFATGAAVGVAGTAIGAAAAHDSSTTTVVTTAPPPPPPATGTIVGSLPGGCTAVASGGGTLYNCNNVFYRPYYQGTTVVYQVVPG